MEGSNIRVTLEVRRTHADVRNRRLVALEARSQEGAGGVEPELSVAHAAAASSSDPFLPELNHTAAAHAVTGVHSPGTAYFNPQLGGASGRCQILGACWWSFFLSCRSRW